jgi:hypothetical protein
MPWRGKTSLPQWHTQGILKKVFHLRRMIGARLTWSEDPKTLPAITMGNFRSLSGSFRGFPVIRHDPKKLGGEWLSVFHGNKWVM